MSPHCCNWSVSKPRLSVSPRCCDWSVSKPLLSVSPRCCDWSVSKPLLSVSPRCCDWSVSKPLLSVSPCCCDWSVSKPLLSVSPRCCDWSDGAVLCDWSTARMTGPWVEIMQMCYFVKYSRNRIRFEFLSTRLGDCEPTLFLIDITLYIMRFQLHNFAESLCSHTATWHHCMKGNIPKGIIGAL